MFLKPPGRAGFYASCSIGVGDTRFVTREVLIRDLPETHRAWEVSLCTNTRRAMYRTVEKHLAALQHVGVVELILEQDRLIVIMPESTGWAATIDTQADRTSVYICKDVRIPMMDVGETEERGTYIKESAMYAHEVCDMLDIPWTPWKDTAYETTTQFLEIDDGCISHPWLRGDNGSAGPYRIGSHYNVPGMHIQDFIACVSIEGFLTNLNELKFHFSLVDQKRTT